MSRMTLRMWQETLCPKPQMKKKKKGDIFHSVASTCDHAVRGLYAPEHLLDESYVGARLQVADALLEDGGEDAPDLGLTGGLTLVQQLHHAHDAVGFLDDEVHLEVKLATDQLQERCKDVMRERKETFLKRHIDTMCVHTRKQMISCAQSRKCDPISHVSETM